MISHMTAIPAATQAIQMIFNRICIRRFMAANEKMTGNHMARHLLNQA